MGDTFAVRLGDAEDDLEVGAGLAGESRADFVRTAIRERAERLRDETTTTEEDTDERRG